MLYLSENPDVACETFCDTYLNVNKAASFAVLSSLYYKILLPNQALQKKEMSTTLSTSSKNTATNGSAT